jgi:hypothetical protein
MRWKKLIITASAAFVVASLAAWGLRARYQAEHPAPPPREQLPDAVVVFFFHGNQRTPKDETLEQCMHGLLERYYPKQLRDGRVVWRTLNYEAPENKPLCEDYQVNGACVVLVDARPHRPGVAKNLQPRTDKLADDKKKLEEYLRDEIDLFY